MRLSCKQADRIFWGIAFCTSLKLWHFGTSPRFNDVIWDPCWQNECKCARAILSYRQKKQKKNVKNIEFEVFTKISSLSPRLAIPMLHIVIKHLKVSLIVYFLRGWTFLRSLLVLTVIWRACITALLSNRIWVTIERTCKRTAKKNRI